ncbi:MAG: hypothetical protein ACLTDR_09090 [Adlercreutzia equolifaciens]
MTTKQDDEERRPRAKATRTAATRAAKATRATRAATTVGHRAYAHAGADAHA